MKRVLAGVALGLVCGAALATQTRAPSVVALADAQVREPPSKKASITLLAQGEEAFLGKLTLAPGGKVTQHRDPTEEYIHVLEGSGVITIDGVEHTLSPGHTVYMLANAEVSYQNGDDVLVAFQVFAGPKSADKYDAWGTR